MVARVDSLEMQEERIHYGAGPRLGSTRLTLGSVAIVCIWGHVSVASKASISQNVLGWLTPSRAAIASRTQRWEARFSAVQRSMAPSRSVQGDAEQGSSM